MLCSLEAMNMNGGAQGKRIMAEGNAIQMTAACPPSPLPPSLPFSSCPTPSEGLDSQPEARYSASCLPGVLTPKARRRKGLLC